MDTTMKGIDGDTWLVLWSKSQGCFHVDTMDSILFANWDRFYGINPNDSDWILMAFADSIKEANELVEEFKRKKAERKDDWYAIEFEDELGLLKGQKTRIKSAQMDLENMLSFLKRQVGRKKKILNIFKNNGALHPWTVKKMVRQAKGKRKSPSE